MFDPANAFAAGVGTSFAVYLSSRLLNDYKTWRSKWPDRDPPISGWRLRTVEEKALALAFATLYEMRGDVTFLHFVVPEDRLMLETIIRKYLRDNRDKLGEMYLGYQTYEDHESGAVEKIVARAEDIFLQI